MNEAEEQLLLRYQSGELEAGECAKVERLLKESAEARAYLAELEELAVGVRDLAEQRLQNFDRRAERERRQKTQTVQLAWTVPAMGLAALLMLLLSFGTTPTPTPEPPQASPALVASVQEPEVQVEDPAVAWAWSARPVVGRPRVSPSWGHDFTRHSRSLRLDQRLRRLQPNLNES